MKPSSWNAGFDGGNLRKLWRCVRGSSWPVRPALTNKEVAAQTGGFDADGG